jgi:hypothetical protein
MSVTSALASLSSAVGRNTSALVSAMQRHKPAYTASVAIPAGGTHVINIAALMPDSEAAYDFGNSTVIIKVTDPDPASPTYNKQIDAAGICPWTVATGTFTFYNTFETALTFSINVRVFRRRA